MRAGLEKEVAGSRSELECHAAKHVRALAWRESIPLETDARADEVLRNAGSDLLFTTHSAVQRTYPAC